MYATRITERVYQLDTKALGQERTVAAYAIKGPKPTLVDCGYASSYRNVLEGLKEIGLSPADIRYVIPTHVHLDHAGAAGHLLREMPNAGVIAHEKAVPHLADPTKLVESATKVFGREIIALYGVPLPVDAQRMTPVGEEGSLELGDGMSARLLHAPGHAPHQIVVLLNEARIMLAADAVGIVYPGMKVMIPTTPPPSFEPETLTRTAGMLAGLDAVSLLVPHFGLRDDPDWVFEQTKTRVEEWLSKVRRMKDEKLGLDEITEALVHEVEEESGIYELPIYARVSARTSVLGILHFLDKNV
ncbi:MAG TPA: MBL fold metallo-hydrolase [Nitrososphaerales archaeon]|nr:MBL fold metallo-hydrolase [Nitrososphaerales archaeon]